MKETWRYTSVNSSLPGELRGKGINYPFYVLLLVALGALKGARPVEREASRSKDRVHSE